MLNEVREFVLLVHQDSKAVKVVALWRNKSWKHAHKVLGRVLIGFVRKNIFTRASKAPVGPSGAEEALRCSKQTLFVPYCINIFVNFDRSQIASTKNTRDKY